MTLKRAVLIVLLIAVGALAYFAIKPLLKENATELRGNKQGAGEKEMQTENKPAASAAKGHSREFNYEPEKPQNGALHGVVEVGASGFNSFVITMDDKQRWEIVSKDFGQSLAYEGLATTDDIRLGLKRYIGAMFDKGVPKNNVHFVVSSGAQKEPKTITISSELKKMGYRINSVTAAEEAKFGFMATVPPPFVDNSFLIDIGSGNTKVSWIENDSLRTLELPGAKYYEKNRADDVIYNEVKTAMSKVPENKRNVAFILGGVPFTLADQHRKGKERYTVLKPPQSYKAKDRKMEAGLNIYKAIADATQTDTFVFDWDANFTIGFLMN
jgi:hypothetical protein